MDEFKHVLLSWIEGKPLREIARIANIDIDTMLGVHARVISYVLQVNLEQGIGLLRKLTEEQDQELSGAVGQFPDYLRFGVANPASLLLASSGVRHRRAQVTLGECPELSDWENGDQQAFLATARRLVEDRERWLPVLGKLVLENTIADLG